MCVHILPTSIPHVVTLRTHHTRPTCTYVFLQNDVRRLRDVYDFLKKLTDINFHFLIHSLSYKNREILQMCGLVAWVVVDGEGEGGLGDGGGGIEDGVIGCDCAPHSDTDRVRVRGAPAAVVP